LKRRTGSGLRILEIVKWNPIKAKPPTPGGMPRASGTDAWLWWSVGVSWDCGIKISIV
jgi:hypothetical protein